MDDLIDLTTTPDGPEPGAEESTETHPCQTSPVIPTEDSYFTEAPPRPKSLGLRDLGVILNNRRRATLHVAIRGAGTAWIDRDDSGTYDPKKERATPTPSLSPPRRRRRARTHDEDGKSITPPPRPRRSRPPVGYRSVITFSLTSEKALNYLRSITPGPYDAQFATPDEEISDSSEVDEACGFGRPLKRRKNKRTRAIREKSEREDGLVTDQLTIGHPQRRGCKACFEVGNDDCSLIEHSQDYPCSACEDASIDCEYIVPPRLKKSCERCKRKRISCSYRLDGGKRVESCDACAEAEVKCLAGPLQGTLRKVDDASSVIAPAPRQYVACNQCRNNSLRCTLKRDAPGPCFNCRKSGEDCQFVWIPASNLSLSVTPPSTKTKRGQKAELKQTHKAAPIRPHDSDIDHTPGRGEGRLEAILLAEAFYHGYHKRSERTLLNERERYKAQTTKKQERLEAEARRKSASTNYTPEFKAPLGISGGIPHIRIKTCFSHPIIFNYNPDPKGMNPCDWCASPFFGQYGHEEIEVEVVPFPGVTGHGYEEMPGGHNDNGHRRTAMCAHCTLDRMTIMNCKKHEFQPIEVDPRVHSPQEVLKSVTALVAGDEVAGQLVTNAKFCAICPSVAYFRCCAHQDEDALISESAGKGCGCGLYLCEACKDLTMKITGVGICGLDVLDQAVHIAANDRFTWDSGVRADSSFLTSTGELMVRIWKNFGENDPVGDGDDGSQSSEGEAGDNPEIWTILERVGKGKGKWNEKQRAAPVSGPRKSGQGSMVQFVQQPKQSMRRGGVGSKRQSSSGSNSQGIRGRRLQAGFGSREEDYVFDEGRGESGSRRAGESPGMGKFGGGVDSKGKGKGKAVMSEVVVISDSEDD